MQRVSNEGDNLRLALEDADTFGFLMLKLMPTAECSAEVSISIPAAIMRIRSNAVPNANLRNLSRSGESVSMVVGV